MWLIVTRANMWREYEKETQMRPHGSSESHRLVWNEVPRRPLHKEEPVISG